MHEPYWLFDYLTVRWRSIILAPCKNKKISRFSPNYEWVNKAHGVSRDRFRFISWSQEISLPPYSPLILIDWKWYIFPADYHLFSYGSVLERSRTKILRKLRFAGGKSQVVSIQRYQCHGAVTAKILNQVRPSRKVQSYFLYFQVQWIYDVGYCTLYDRIETVAHPDAIF